ncbi:MAG TPA: DUF5677 domain-containing protein [Candidatus Acidoferrales bacterium]|nr:DUF5677 domain-containing protein [Candidatus Acidoferrales bacterium]
MGSLPIDEDQFKQFIYTKHQPYFDHVYRLFMFAQEALRNYKGLATDAYYASLQLICPRAFKSFDSVRRLCEIASCEDAAVVLRSLLNLMAVTRWISLDPTKRGKRYLAWYWVQMYRISQQSKARFPQAWIPETHKRYAAEKAQFEYQDGKGRTQMVKHWYQPEANTIRDLFKQVELEQHYVEAYEPLSGVEHSDVMAFFPMIAHAERREEENERALAIQSDLYVPHYLRNAFQYFADIFGMCNKTMPLADDKRFREIVDEGIQFYKAQMIARGIQP